MKRRELLTAIAFAATNPAVASGAHTEGTPHYYRSFAARSVPEKPLRRLTRTEALNATMLAHYVAHYTRHGHLKRFAKHFKGKVQWESTYEYSSAGLLLKGCTTSWTSPGEVVRTHYEFDVAGKVASSHRTVSRA